ncbi:MAG: cytochrome c-type biogenesis protein CcmH [Anaerolineae bacterium]|nr:cytochrome c-type biogenesis protein CcmH [Anaerolineae bacterium]
MRRSVVVGLAALVLLVALAGQALAQGGVSSADIDARMRTITSRLNCPLCQGQTLTECPLQVCDEMRDLIRQKLLAGESEEQIRIYFVERFGDRVLNEPPRTGFALLGWVTPVVAILAGVGILALVLRGMLRRPPPPTPSAATAAAPVPPSLPPSLPNEYVERLERELREME